MVPELALTPPCSARDAPACTRADAGKSRAGGSFAPAEPRERGRPAGRQGSAMAIMPHASGFRAAAEQSWWVAVTWFLQLSRHLFNIFSMRWVHLVVSCGRIPSLSLYNLNIPVSVPVPRGRFFSCIFKVQLSSHANTGINLTAEQG